MKRFVIPMVALAFLTAACGTASGSTGSAGAGQAAIGRDRVQVNPANAASSESDVTRRQPDSGDRAATRVVTAPAIAQTVSPAAVALPPGGRTGCGSDAGFGKGRPMCPPE
jgi:predicted small secreted protein